MLAIEPGGAGDGVSQSRESKLAALGRKEFTKADLNPGLFARILRLDKWVEAAAARGVPSPEAPRASSATATLLADDITDELVERVIGKSNDLLSIEFFEQGLDAAQAVGRVVPVGEANGTGFLVAPSLLLTNEHVLRSLDEARRAMLDRIRGQRFGPSSATDLPCRRRFFLQQGA